MTLSSYSPESWEYARGYANLMGQVPSSFSSVIRGLVQAHNNGEREISGNTKYFLLRLLRSKSLLSPLYFARKAWEPDLEERAPGNMAEEVLSTFPPLTVAYMLALVYLTKRCRAICNSEEWPFLTSQICENGNIGYVMGSAIPAIGPAVGLMEGTIRYIGLATFLRHDMKGFREYRREVKRNHGQWDDSYEFKVWGCNSFQVSSVILQIMGFGIAVANAYVKAFSVITEHGTDDEKALAKRFKMAGIWREVLATGSMEPNVALPAKFYPERQALERASDIIGSLQADESSGMWLEKGKGELARTEKAQRHAEQQEEEIEDEIPLEEGEIEGEDDLEEWIEEDQA